MLQEMKDKKNGQKQKSVLNESGLVFSRYINHYLQNRSICLHLNSAASLN
jgi:hypothetical protein